jgi:hypothetical protein
MHTLSTMEITIDRWLYLLMEYLQLLWMMITKTIEYEEMCLLQGKICNYTYRIVTSVWKETKEDKMKMYT